MMAIRDLKRRPDTAKGKETKTMSIDHLTEVPCDLFYELMQAAERAKNRGQHTLARDRLGVKRLQKCDNKTDSTEVGRPIAPRDVTSGARAFGATAGLRPMVSLSAASMAAQGSLPPPPKESPPLKESTLASASSTASAQSRSSDRWNSQSGFPGLGRGGIRIGAADLFGLRKTEPAFRFRAASSAVEPCRSYKFDTPKMATGTKQVWRTSAKSLLAHDVPTRVRVA